MSYDPNWWMNHVGETGAATSGRTSPTPDFGLAVDVGQAATLDGRSREEIVDAMITMSEDQDMEAMQERVVQRMLAQNLEDHDGDLFAAIGATEDDMFRMEHDRDPSWWDKVKRGAGNVGDTIGGWFSSGVGAVGSGVGQVRDWMRAGDRWVLGDERAEALHRNYDLAYEAAGNAGTTALETMHESYQLMDRALATPLIVGHIRDRDGMGAIISGDAWAEAWTAADDVTAGQTLFDGLFLDPSSPFSVDGAQGVAAAYERGFDDMGRPLDAAYRELRESHGAYNLMSGAADFIKAWYLDPTVVGAKAAGATRAHIRGDLTNMGRHSGERVRRIITASEDELRMMHVPKLDLVGQNALRLRQRMHERAQEVRSGNIDEVGLVATEFAFKDAPDAAALFAQAARTKKVDPQTGQILDEFDDDFFRAAMGAAMGDGNSLARLHEFAGGQDVVESIRRMQEQRIHAMSDLAEISERQFRDAISAGLPREMAVERAFQNLDDFGDAMRRQIEAETSLGQFTSYQNWIATASTRVDMSGLRAVPGAGSSVPQTALRDRGLAEPLRGLPENLAMSDVRTSLFRPAAANGKAAVYMKPPKAWHRARPGVVDLHRPNESFVNADRYFDQMKVYAGEGVVRQYGAGQFEQIRHRILRDMTRATTDVERRRAAARMEELGVQLVAQKHGLSPDKARAIAAQVDGRRAALFRDIERQHAENVALTGRQVDPDAPIGQVKFAEGDNLITTDMPLTLTELKNQFFATDLRALDGLLKQHARGMDSLLNDAVNRGTSALEFYNQFWKPSVLFRLGYPIRTVSDDFLRALAMSNNAVELLARSAQGAAIGVANMVPRTYNFLRKPWNKQVRERWHARNEDAIRGTSSVADIDPVRQDAIHQRLGGVERYEWDRLNAEANGRSLGRRHVPQIVRKLDGILENNQSFAMDVASGRKLRRNQETWDFGLSRGRELDRKPTAVEVARYAEQNADRLSHVDGVLMVQRTGEDTWRMSIGRKGPNYKHLPLLQQQSMTRGVSVWGREGREERFGAPAEEGVADMMVPLASSGSDWRAFGRSIETNVRDMRGSVMRAKRSQVADGTAHARLWAEVIERKLATDPVVRRLIETGDPDQVIRWLHTSEGRAHAQRMPWRSADEVRWMDELQQLVNDLLPDETLRTKLVQNQRISSDELWARMQGDPKFAPASIDEAGIEMVTGRGSIPEQLNRFTDRAYNVLATLPTDTLARNPFFRAQYRSRLQGFVDSLDPDRVITDSMRRSMEKQSREFALRQTRRYLFNLSDSTDLVHFMRFMSPFMGAWQETMVRWATIAMERPQAIQRLWINGWFDMDKLAFVDMIDEEGRDKNDPNHGELTHIRMQVPEAMRNVMGKLLPGEGAEKAADLMHTLSFNRDSLNAILQGDPFWLPGMGPVVQFPAAYGVKNAPWLKDANALTEHLYKYLFPTGVPDWHQAIFPAGWQQSLMRWVAQEDDPVFQNYAAIVHKTRLMRWHSEGADPDLRPTESESSEIAHILQGFMWVGRFFSPGSFQIEPGDPGRDHSSKFWIDAANRMYEEMPDATESERYLAFLEQYGEDAWLWWTSNSENATGIPATSKAHRAQKANADLIRDFPELGLAIVGLDTMDGAFNYDVYLDQQASGPPHLRRRRLSPEEAAAKAESEKGWAEWNRINQLIDTELVARGITTTLADGSVVAGNINRNGAEDLARVKDAFKARLFQQLPGWREDFESFDSGRGYRMVDAFKQAIRTGNAPDPRFRPDWAGIHEYLRMHDKIGAELDARYTGGGSRNINHEDNGDLRIVWDRVVAQIVQNNLEFADLYHRFFERHELTMGSGHVAFGPT